MRGSRIIELENRLSKHTSHNVLLKSENVRRVKDKSTTYFTQNGEPITPFEVENVDDGETPITSSRSNLAVSGNHKN